MRLGLHVGYWGLGLTADEQLSLVKEAEELGFDSVWSAEAYGSDAATVLAWIAGQTEKIKLGSAIFQMPGRTPAMTAMTAATLDQISGGRVLLGIGSSGPQVAEGWHGQAFGKPLGRTREYVSVVREILRREAPLEHHGEHYDIPYSGEDSTGLGKPLKLIVHPLRAEIPIYLAAIGPRNVALAAEIADGWLPIFFSPERFAEVHAPQLEVGFAVRGGRPDGWDLAPLVPVVVADDATAARDFLKPLLALYIGGMGARGQNFYTRLAQRYGYEETADRIQEHYLAGRKSDAIATVPDALVDEVALVGDRARIAHRLDAWHECGATTLILQARQPKALRLLAELVL